MATPTVEEFLRAYDARPRAVRSALTVAATATLLRDIPATTFRVLLALLSRIDRKQPDAEFSACGLRCADEAGANRKTFSRAIERFETCGWIERAGGGRRPSGRFGAMRFRLTGDLLDLIAKAFTGNAAGTPPKTPPREAGMSHGYLSTCNLSEDQKGPRIERATNPVPDDLKPLERFGIEAPAIWKLVGLASKAGHRLANLVAIAVPYMERAQLAGKRAYCYLLTMTKRASDYASRAGARHAEATSLRDKEEKNSRLQAGREAVAGRQYEGRDGAIFKVEPGNVLASRWHAGGHTGTVQIDQSFLDAVRDGRLRLIES